MTVVAQHIQIDQVDEYVSALKPIAKMSVLGRGVFRAGMTRAWLPGVLLQAADISQPVIARMLMPPQLVFGFGASDGPSESWNGEPLAPGSLVAHRPGQEMRLLGHGKPWGSLTVSHDRLAEVWSWLVDDAMPARQDWRMVTPAPAEMERLRSVHAAGIRAVSGGRAESKAAAASIEDSVLRALVRCLSGGISQRSTARGNRATVLRRLDAVLDAQAGDPLSLIELCRQVGVPARTLATICGDVFGMSPVRYLRLRRLELARTALRQADPATDTVTDIATRFGFWELGRFAAAYRAQFGELPSATLGRL